MRTSAPNQKVGAEVLFATQKIYHKKNYSLFDVLCVWVEFSRLSDDRCMLTKYLTNVASDWAVRRNLFNLNESYEIVPAIWAGYPKCTSAQYCKSPELPNQLDSLITIFSIFVPRAIFYKFAANPCPKKSITTYLHMSWMHNNQLIALWAHFIKDFIIFFIQNFDHTSYYLKKKLQKIPKDAWNITVNMVYDFVSALVFTKCDSFKQKVGVSQKWKCTFITAFSRIQKISLIKLLCNQSIHSL